jgi:drug/metabolite transporter (DMT)-like permease
MKTKKHIGWIAFLLGVFAMMMNYFLAYYPPESIDSSNSIIVVNMILTIALIIIALVYLFNAYDEN